MIARFAVGCAGAKLFEASLCRWSVIMICILSPGKRVGFFTRHVFFSAWKADPNTEISSMSSCLFLPKHLVLELAASVLFGQVFLVRWIIRCTKFSGDYYLRRWAWVLTGPLGPRALRIPLSNRLLLKLVELLMSCHANWRAFSGLNLSEITSSNLQPSQVLFRFFSA